MTEYRYNFIHKGFYYIVRKNAVFSWICRAIDMTVLSKGTSGDFYDRSTSIKNISSVYKLKNLMSYDETKFSEFMGRNL